MDLDGPTLWRLLNAAMAIVALALMVVHTVQHYDDLPPRRRLLAQAHCGLLLAVVIGGVENIAQDNPIGFRTALVSASVLWTSFALIGTREEKS